MFEEYLKKALLEEKLPNTLLFSGPKELGKKTALWLASELLQVPLDRIEVHPDFHLMTPEGAGALHSIESVRKAIDTSQFNPFSAPAKIFLIEFADQMQPAAANALLKTLEEPILDSYWILLSEKAQEMLPTLLSRCTKLSIRETGESPLSPECQEAKTLLLSLLEKRPSYPTLFLSLEKIGLLMEEKDPAPLFIAIANYFLELERKNSVGPWQEAFDQARLGLERNIKLSTCLEFFFIIV